MRIAGTLRNAIEVIVILAGVIFVLISGYVDGLSVLQKLLENIGTGCIAAGIVSVLGHIYLSSESVEKESAVSIVANNRLDLDREYLKRQYTSRHLDVVAIGLTGALDEMANDPNERMLKRVMFDQVKIRMMFLSPNAQYVRQRAAEDGISKTELERGLRGSVRNCERIFEKLNKLYITTTTSGAFHRDQIGGIEIRILNACPHFTLFNADEEILWGIYTSTQLGYFSPVLAVTKLQRNLYDQLCSHFETLWNSNLGGDSAVDNSLIRLYGWNPPVKNHALFSRLLNLSSQDN